MGFFFFQAPPPLFFSPSPLLFLPLSFLSTSSVFFSFFCYTRKNNDEIIRRMGKQILGRSMLRS